MANCKARFGFYPRACKVCNRCKSFYNGYGYFSAYDDEYYEGCVKGHFNIRNKKPRPVSCQDFILKTLKEGFIEKLKLFTLGMFGMILWFVLVYIFWCVAK